MRLLAGFLILLSGVVSANQLTDKQIAGLEHCNKVSEVSEIVMNGRQSGNPMADAMALAVGQPWIEEIIIKAYEAPIGATPTERRQAVDAFRDGNYLACFQRMKDSKS